MPLAAEPLNVETWRYDTLLKAGFVPDDAMRLATNPTVDLHAAIELVAAGCPLELAVEILR